MRALLVSFVADTEATGMGRWTHRIAAELRDQGWEVTLWFEDQFPRLRKLGRAAVLAAPVSLLARLLRVRDSFDVVIVHEPLGFWYGLWRRLLHDGPALVTMCHNVESRVYRTLETAQAHGLAQLNPGHVWKAPLFRLWQTDGAIRFADHVLCLSSLDERYIAERLGRSSSEVTCLQNGVDDGDVEPRTAAKRGKRVLFVGGWLDVKGRRVLPRLWAEVARRHPDARLTVVGSTASQETVRSAFAEDVRSSIAVVPRIETVAIMRRVYADQDIFLMPSLTEGSPLSLLEAMSAGLTIVASRVGGIVDLIQDGTSGALFDPLDMAEATAALLTVLEDTELAASFAKLSTARAAELHWSHTATTLRRAIDNAHLTKGAPNG